MFNHKNIGLNIFIIDKYFKVYLKQSLKQYNLNSAEGLVLLVLYKYQGEVSANSLDDFHSQGIGKTQDEIISELHYDKGVITRTMQSLEDKHYVIRKNNPLDNRSYIFELTKEGFLFKPTLMNILAQLNNMMLEGIDDEMVALLNSKLNQIVDNIICFNKKQK